MEGATALPSLVPGIQHRDAEPGEIFDVAGNDGEIMLKGGCGDQAVGRVERRSAKLTFAGKPRTQRLVHPFLQMTSPLAFGENRQPFEQFTETDHAQIQLFVVSFFEPTLDARI